jgi:hypothetical protein
MANESDLQSSPSREPTAAVAGALLVLALLAAVFAASALWALAQGRLAWFVIFLLTDSGLYWALHVVVTVRKVKWGGVWSRLSR